MKLRFVALMLGSIALFSGSISVADDVVKTFSGSGGKNTRPFTVQQGWEIQWNASGDIFQLYLYSPAGEMLGVPANQQGPGKGSSYQPNAGEYYLEVKAIGDWNIRIVNLE